MTMVTLWHGTTLSEARRIFHQGMRRINTSATVRDIARHFGVEAVLIRRLLDQWGRVHGMQDHPDAAAWFTTNREAANCWAQRAPQAKWDALWAVWCIQSNALDEPSPWLDPEASAWHVDKFFEDPPAVVEARAPSTDLGTDPTPTDDHDGWREAISNGTVLEVAMRLPVSGERIVGYDVVNRRISVAAAAGLTGRTAQQLIDLSDNGEIVPPRESGCPVGERYWTIDDIFDLVDDT